MIRFINPSVNAFAQLNEQGHSIGSGVGRAGQLIGFGIDGNSMNQGKTAMTLWNSYNWMTLAHLCTNVLWDAQVASNGSDLAVKARRVDSVIDVHAMIQHIQNDLQI